MTRSPWLHVLCTITCAALSVVASLCALAITCAALFVVASLCALATLADGAVAVAVACSVLALVAVEERDSRARRARRPS